MCQLLTSFLSLLSISLTVQDLLDSDWASVRKVLEQADILVIKYAVTDKLAFQQVRNGYAPRLRPLLRHWGVPVILVAVGARLNGEHARCLCSVLFVRIGSSLDLSLSLYASLVQRNLKGPKHKVPYSLSDLVLLHRVLVNT